MAEQESSVGLHERCKWCSAGIRRHPSGCWECPQLEMNNPLMAFLDTLGCAMQARKAKLFILQGSPGQPQCSELSEPRADIAHPQNPELCAAWLGAESQGT